MYEIAKYLPLEAREVACNIEYNQFVGSCSSRRSFHGKDEYGRCPLGEVLYSMGDLSNAPTAPHVAQFLSERNEFDLEQRYDCYVSAIDFILDWDTGIITNLKEALGVNS